MPEPKAWQKQFQEWYEKSEPKFRMKVGWSRAEEEAERKRIGHYKKKEIMGVAREIRDEVGLEIKVKDMERFMWLITRYDPSDRRWLPPTDIEGVVHDCFLYLKGMSEAGHPLPEIIDRVENIKEKTRFYYYSKAVVHFLFMYWGKDNETIVKKMNEYF